ncbi:MAG: hypothetical protein QXM38_01315 [Candidatus Aenigmatarchaeota archaeon]
MIESIPEYLRKRPITVKYIRWFLSRFYIEQEQVDCLINSWIRQGLIAWHGYGKIVFKVIRSD